jgi:MFS family permease
MNGGVRVRLSVMMFLQYAVWGVWAVVISLYLQSLPSFRENTFDKINMIFLTMAIASILSPFIAGQFADRYFSTERFLAFSHLVGGALILWAAQITTFWGLFWVMMGHCLLYAPTVSLTNSLSFHHLPNGEKDFGAIRLWGTIGWIVVGWVFSFWLSTLALQLGIEPNVGQCLVFAAALSFVMAAYCLTLPHTPPATQVENPWAFLGALRLAKDRSFAVMLVVAFLVSTELQFYYALTPNFFADDPGPSLSPQQLQQAAGCTEKEAALLMRLLDKNGNNKLSKVELEQSAERLKELTAAEAALEKAGEPKDKDGLAQLLKGTTVVTDTRTPEVIAGYVIKAAEGESLTQTNATEVQQFLDKVTPV